MYAPHFAVYAILSLTGQLDPVTDSNWYSLEDMRSIAAGGGLAVSASVKQAAALAQAAQTKEIKTCMRKYVFVDANDQPLYRADGKTKAIVQGTEYACPKLQQYDDKKNADDVAFWNTRITKGDGSRTTSGGMPVADGEFGNEPSAQFN